MAEIFPSIWPLCLLLYVLIESLKNLFEYWCDNIKIMTHSSWHSWEVQWPMWEEELKTKQISHTSWEEQMFELNKAMLYCYVATVCHGIWLAHFTIQPTCAFVKYFTDTTLVVWICYCFELVFIKTFRWVDYAYTHRELGTTHSRFMVTCRSVHLVSVKSANTSICSYFLFLLHQNCW